MEPRYDENDNDDDQERNITKCISSYLDPIYAESILILKIII